MTEPNGRIPADQSEALSVARIRRVALFDAVAALEFAAAGPAGKGPGWWRHVGDELHVLREALCDHIHTVEAENGLMAEILEEAPRLAPIVGDLKDEHGELCEGVDLALDLVTSQLVEPQPDQVDEIRDMVVSLLVLLTKHRQRGADLVYEAYDVDIGGP